LGHAERAEDARGKSGKVAADGVRKRRKEGDREVKGEQDRKVEIGEE